MPTSWLPLTSDFGAFARACPIQGIDPRVRMAVAVVLSLVLAAVQGFAAACIGLLAGALWLLLALAGRKPPVRALLHRLFVVNIFVLLVWCTTPWAMPGETLAALGPLAIQREGLELALLVTLKVNALACVFIGLLATLDIPSLTSGLRFFHCPQKLVLLLVMALRNIHVLGEEWQRLRTAAMLRGFAPRCSLHAYRTLANLLGLLFLRSLDRATRVREAMLLRGFSGDLPQGTLPSLRMRDIGCLALAALQATAICACEMGMAQ